MKALVTAILICTTTVCLSQKIYSNIGMSDEPIFKTKGDSIQYSNLQIILSKPFANSTVPYNLDSLFKLRNQLMQQGILGYRKVYRPNPDFFSYENLNDTTNYDGIKELSISKGRFRKLPAKVFKCKKLEALQLTNVSITRIQRRANRLTNLKTIILLNNTPAKSLKLTKNNKVETLIIRGEKSHYLPHSYRKFKSLISLDLSYNSIVKFPTEANHNKKLKELKLTNNLITLNNDEIKPNPYLEKLDLTKNKLIKIPASIKNLSTLKTLKFNFNSITEIAPEISLLTTLENLSLYNNQLCSIPSGVYQLKFLKEIDLYYNQIEKLDERVINWQNLEVLYLAFNKVYALSDNLGKLKNLQELYLHDNRLSTLPDNLSGLAKLTVLRINNNYMPLVPTSIFQLSNLENLDISKNQIQSLPANFFNIEHLKILALVANPWDKQTKEMLPAKAKELRAREVIVHLNSFEEDIEY